MCEVAPKHSYATLRDTTIDELKAKWSKASAVFFHCCETQQNICLGAKKNLTWRWTRGTPRFPHGSLAACSAFQPPTRAFASNKAVFGVGVVPTSRHHTECVTEDRAPDQDRPPDWSRLGAVPRSRNRRAMRRTITRHSPPARAGRTRSHRRHHH